MLTEEQVKTRLHLEIAEWLTHKSFMEFFEAKRPSVVKDRLARATGQHGYGYRLSEWEEVTAIHRKMMMASISRCQVLAWVLEEPVDMLWTPEKYLEGRDVNTLHPVLQDELQRRTLGAEAHLHSARLMADIPPSRG